MVVTEDLKLPARSADGDEQWVREALAGDRSAFGYLYDRYAAVIRAICHDTTGDLHEAQDLCQETFLRAYRHLPELRDHSRFGGWLYGIGRMLCRDWRRRTGREKRRHRSLSGAEPAAASTEEFAADRDAHLLLAVSQLPEQERTSLHLFYLQDESIDKARAVMRLSRSGFYHVLERARRRLRRVLERSEEVGQ